MYAFKKDVVNQFKNNQFKNQSFCNVMICFKLYKADLPFWGGKSPFYGLSHNWVCLLSWYVSSHFFLNLLTHLYLPCFYQIFNMGMLSYKILRTVRAKTQFLSWRSLDSKSHSKNKPGFSVVKEDIAKTTPTFLYTIQYILVQKQTGIQSCVKKEC